MEWASGIDTEPNMHFTLASNELVYLETDSIMDWRNNTGLQVELAKTRSIPASWIVLQALSGVISVRRAKNRSCMPLNKVPKQNGNK